MSLPRLSVRILGCGSSGGVPRVGNQWGACDPSDPRNVRTRCSILIRHRQPGRDEDTVVLVDTSPDLRTQLLSAGTERLDAILMSHHHADQCHGIDDVRPLVLAQRAPIPVFMDADTSAILLERFGYCFQGHAGYPAILTPRSELIANQPITIAGRGGDMEIVCLDQDHGTCRSLGFRVGPFAYCNDVVDLPDETFELLAGVEVLVVDALRYAPHPTHAHVDKALEWIERIGPKRSVLTNLHVDLDFAGLDQRTPATVEPAYDGLELEIPYSRA